jgi:hypothetical protein
VKASNGPYALPHTLERDLARVHEFWEGLKRHEAEMPFWDDVKISALPDLAGRLMMVEATDKPVRFRIAFGLVGADIKQRYGHDLSGKFLDEIDAAAPLQFLQSQCSATVESRAPTYYRNDDPAAIRGSCCRYGATAASACCWSPVPSRKRLRGAAALRH